jgi:hypothetical protein
MFWLFLSFIQNHGYEKANGMPLATGDVETKNSSNYRWFEL